MSCQFKNHEGQVDAIMCGTSGNFCYSDQWCSNPTNVKYSYWTNNTYSINHSCVSDGKVISYD